MRPGLAEFITRIAMPRGQASLEERHGPLDGDPTYRKVSSVATSARLGNYEYNHCCRQPPMPQSWSLPRDTAHDLPASAVELPGMAPPTSQGLPCDDPSARAYMDSASELGSGSDGRDRVAEPPSV